LTFSLAIFDIQEAKVSEFPEIESVIDDLKVLGGRHDQTMSTVRRVRDEDPEWPETEALSDHEVRAVLAGRNEDAERKIQELEAKHATELRAIRVRGRELIEAARANLPIEALVRESEHGPQRVKEWAEAETRARFVAEDVRGLSPERVLHRYRAAVQADDPILTWLVQRYGRRELQARAAEAMAGDASGEAVRYKGAAQQLYTLHYGETDTEARARSLDVLAQALNNPVSESDRRANDERLKTRFGI